jgi:hypothetical protein
MFYWFIFLRNKDKIQPCNIYDTAKKVSEAPWDWSVLTRPKKCGQQTNEPAEAAPSVRHTLALGQQRRELPTTGSQKMVSTAALHGLLPTTATLHGPARLYVMSNEKIGN